jgi:hypothetical protein
MEKESLSIGRVILLKTTVYSDSNEAEGEAAYACLLRTGLGPPVAASRQDETTVLFYGRVKLAAGNSHQMELRSCETA